VSEQTHVPRILVVDDHPAVLLHVQRLLAAEFDVVDTLSDGRDLPEAVAARRPDLVVLDITLPGTSGIDLARALTAAPAAPLIVFLTVHADPDYVREALAAGGSGYVVKSRLASDLIPALHAALAGEQFVSPILGPK
jgi:DNA-binding NarL/FixJ family response regulator